MTMKDEHPEASHFLEAGGFSVQIGPLNPFGRIPVDQMYPRHVCPKMMHQFRQYVIFVRTVGRIHSVMMLWN